MQQRFAKEQQNVSICAEELFAQLLLVYTDEKAAGTEVGGFAYF